MRFSNSSPLPGRIPRAPRATAPPAHAPLCVPFHASRTSTAHTRAIRCYRARPNSRVLGTLCTRRQLRRGVATLTARIPRYWFAVATVSDVSPPTRHRGRLTASYASWLHFLIPAACGLSCQAAHHSFDGAICIIHFVAAHTPHACRFPLHSLFVVRHAYDWLAAVCPRALLHAFALAALNYCCSRLTVRFFCSSEEQAQHSHPGRITAIYLVWNVALVASARLYRTAAWASGYNASSTPR